VSGKSLPNPSKGGALVLDFFKNKMENKLKNITIKQISHSNREEVIWQILETVTDPEVPALSILDLGIVRDVSYSPSLEGLGEVVEVVITPTYTGCPAMDMIAVNIKLALIENGFTNIKIETVLSPAWTTDWMTEAGKQKLQKYGIAPPSRNNIILCPQCKSNNVNVISEFGSTACKSLYQCQDCKEPFDYFKCH
jgi:ring-1,2-phenylacetyl-CoA epoxidase subunit PaaD